MLLSHLKWEAELYKNILLYFLFIIVLMVKALVLAVKNQVLLWKRIIFVAKIECNSQHCAQIMVR